MFKVITSVEVSPFAEKQIKRIPRQIQEALRNWVESVKWTGIRETRKFKGFHDEPLHGSRKGQRSVRLNRAYRIIYREEIESILLIVIEVTKHAY